MVTVTLMVAGLAAWTTEAKENSTKKQTIPLAKKGTVFFTVSHPLSKDFRLLTITDSIYIGK
jgi:hypothetical protein